MPLASGPPPRASKPCPGLRPAKFKGAPAGFPRTAVATSSSSNNAGAAAAAAGAADAIVTATGAMTTAAAALAKAKAAHAAAAAARPWGNHPRPPPGPRPARPAQPTVVDDPPDWGTDDQAPEAPAPPAGVPLFPPVWLAEIATAVNWVPAPQPTGWCEAEAERLVAKWVKWVYGRSSAFRNEWDGLCGRGSTDPAHYGTEGCARFTRARTREVAAAWGAGYGWPHDRPKAGPTHLLLQRPPQPASRERSRRSSPAQQPRGGAGARTSAGAGAGRTRRRRRATRNPDGSRSPSPSSASSTTAPAEDARKRRRTHQRSRQRGTTRSSRSQPVRLTEAPGRDRRGRRHQRRAASPCAASATAGSSNQPLASAGAGATAAAPPLMVPPSSPPPASLVRAALSRGWGRGCSSGADAPAGVPCVAPSAEMRQPPPVATSPGATPAAEATAATTGATELPTTAAAPVCPTTLATPAGNAGPTTSADMQASPTILAAPAGDAGPATSGAPPATDGTAPHEASITETAPGGGGTRDDAPAPPVKAAMCSSSAAEAGGPPVMPSATPPAGEQQPPPVAADLGTAPATAPAAAAAGESTVGNELPISEARPPLPFAPPAPPGGFVSLSWMRGARETATRRTAEWLDHCLLQQERDPTWLPRMQALAEAAAASSHNLAATVDATARSLNLAAAAAGAVETAEPRATASCEPTPGRGDGRHRQYHQRHQSGRLCGDHRGHGASHHHGRAGSPDQASAYCECGHLRGHQRRGARRGSSPGDQRGRLHRRSHGSSSGRCAGHHSSCGRGHDRGRGGHRGCPRRGPRRRRGRPLRQPDDGAAGSPGPARATVELRYSTRVSCPVLRSPRVLRWPPARRPVCRRTEPHGRGVAPAAGRPVAATWRHGPRATCASRGERVVNAGRGPRFGLGTVRKRNCVPSPRRHLWLSTNTQQPGTLYFRSHFSAQGVRPLRPAVAPGDDGATAAARIRQPGSAPESCGEATPPGQLLGFVMWATLLALCPCHYQPSRRRNGRGTVPRVLQRPPWPRAHAGTVCARVHFLHRPARPWGARLPPTTRVCVVRPTAWRRPVVRRAARGARRDLTTPRRGLSGHATPDRARASRPPLGPTVVSCHGRSAQLRRHALRSVRQTRQGPIAHQRNGAGRRLWANEAQDLRPQRGTVVSCHGPGGCCCTLRPASTAAAEPWAAACVCLPLIPLRCQRPPPERWHGGAPTNDPAPTAPRAVPARPADRTATLPGPPSAGPPYGPTSASRFDLASVRPSCLLLPSGRAPGTHPHPSYLCACGRAAHGQVRPGNCPCPQLLRLQDEAPAAMEAPRGRGCAVRRLA